MLINEITEGTRCWKGYKKKGMKTMFGKRVPNCVKNEEVEVDENLRDWFKLIYEVVFGDENGPRMGFFISFFGVNETKELIKEKIK